MKQESEYHESIRQLAVKARAWCRAHPDARPKVQFHYPETMALVTTLSAALDVGAVAADGDGKAMLAAMGEGIPEHEEPTPTMIRIALDIMHSDELDTPLHPRTHK